MAKIPFYKTGISQTPLTQISDKRKKRLAGKVRDAYNATTSSENPASTNSREARKFQRKLNRYRKKTGGSDWYIY